MAPEVSVNDFWSRKGERMSGQMEFSYFYQQEADMYSFYRIPKKLFTDYRFRDLSTEAKVLYGLMLDRMSLSMKNQWMDEERKVYIYFSLDDVMELLNCKKNKAIATMKELDSEHGIGLIEKIRQGQGKPSIIYVKNFMSEPEQKLEKKTSVEKTGVSEVGKTNVLRLAEPTSRSPFLGNPDVGKRDTNNIDKNNTERNETKSNQFQSGRDFYEGAVCDQRDEVEKYSELIKRNISMDMLLQSNPYDRELIEGIFDLILETVLAKGEYIVIASNSYPRELVKSKFLKLEYAHIVYVLNCMESNTTKVYNIKKYLLAALFNAPTTISGYYQAEVHHDMPELAIRKAAL